MDELSVPCSGTSDFYIMKAVCHAVSVRSASLVAAGAISRLFHRNLLIRYSVGRSSEALTTTTRAHWRRWRARAISSDLCAVTTRNTRAIGARRR